VAKKSVRTKSKDVPGKFNFEEAISALERIVQDLEDGQLGLDASLSQYEDGMKHLRQCYRLLDDAERKIQLLQRVDKQGQPVTEPFEEANEPLEEKAGLRASRRSHRAQDSTETTRTVTTGTDQESAEARPRKANRAHRSHGSDEADDNNVDLPGALF